MGKHNKSDSLNSKMDKLLNKFTSVEEKLDKRMSKLEDECKSLKTASKSHDKKQKILSNEVSYLKAKLNEIEQEKLNCNMTIKGVNETETENGKHTEGLVEFLLKRVNKDFEPSDVVSCKRIGVKKQGTRPILVKFIDEKAKMAVMDGKKKTKLDCSMIPLSDKQNLGTSDEVIYFADHLTSFSATLHYHARHLKKRCGFKFVWTKMGRVYVRKDENERAVLIKSLEQIKAIKKKNKESPLSSTKNDSSSSDESSGSESNYEDLGESNTEHEYGEDGATSRAKRHRSKGETSKKSPSPKRPNTRSHKH